MPKQIQIAEFGGINQADGDETLFNRAMQGHENGYAQKGLLESSKMQNMDFVQGGIKQRLGSTAYKTITFAASDTKIIGTHLWVDPATGSSIEVAVTDKSIYVKTGAAFAQVNNSAGNAYTHSSDVTKCSFSEVDGHLFIGLDGTNNYIQAYRSGADLDDHLHAESSSVLVASDATAGTNTVYVTDISIFAVNDRIILNRDLAGEQSNYVTSLNSGSYLSLSTNLAFDYSYDLTFTEKSSQITTSSGAGIAHGNSVWVCSFGSAGGKVQMTSSADGSTWVDRSFTPTAGHDKNMSDVCFGTSAFIAVGQSEMIIRSVNGTTWGEVNFNAVQSFYCVGYGNGKFVAAGTGSLLETSDDEGLTWTSRTVATSGDYFDAAYGNGLYVIVGYTGAAMAIDTSTNGTTWGAASSIPAINTRLKGVAYGGGKWVAVGDDDGTEPVILTSTDGDTWTQQTAGVPNDTIDLNSVTYDQGTGLFVAVGDADAADGYVLQSSDGETWAQIGGGGKAYDLARVHCNNGVFVAVGENDTADVYLIKSDAPSDTVEVANEYVEAFDTSTTHEITGAWDKATYLLSELHTRLLSSTGNTLVNYTPQAYETGSGIWDGENSGFIQVKGNIKSLNSFSPEMSDSLKQALYVGTSNGFHVTTGFTDADNVMVIDGAKSPLNHTSAVATENWLVYMTTDGNIMGINGTNVINLGRRLKNKSGSGILDSIYNTSSNTDAFGFYNPNKKQVQFYFATGATYVNDTCVVIDMELGDPQRGESAPSFESRIKCLYWKVGTETPNKSWFKSMYAVGENIYGALGSGVLYLLESGKKDFGDTAIVSYWKTPQITGGSLSRLKQWLRVSCIFALETASTALNVNAYVDRGSSSILTSKTFDLTNGANGISYGTQRIDRRSKYLQVELGNSTSNEEWTLQNMDIHYEIGAEINN